MVGVSFSLSKPKQKISAIRISVQYSGNRFFLYPGLSIKKTEWDTKKKFPREGKGINSTSFIIRELRRLEEQIKLKYDELIIKNARYDHKLFRDEMISFVKNKSKISNKGIPLLDAVNRFIHDSENGKRLSYKDTLIDSNTLKTYNTLKNHLINFEKKRSSILYITNTTQNFVDSFANYIVTDLGLSKNTLSKIMANLKLVLEYSVKLQYFKLNDFLTLKFKTAREEADNIFVSEDEIQALLEINNFKSKIHETVRDLFVIGCRTGMRFGNLTRIQLDHMNDGFLRIIQVKTKEEALIPIHKTVGEIIKKYNGVLPKAPCNQVFNRIIKEVGKTVECLNKPFVKKITRNQKVVTIQKMKYEFLQSHTARRSFCTNEYLKGTPDLNIMAASGHKSHKRFKTYIKADNLDNAKRLREEWKSRGELYEGN